MQAPPQSQFAVAAIGFDAPEKKVLQSMFGISAGRSPSFVSYKFSREKRADMVLLDYDNPNARLGWEAYQLVHPSAAKTPVVAVSRDAVEDVAFVLRRPVVATRLLGMLERVATDALGFVHADAFEDATTVIVSEDPLARTHTGLQQPRPLADAVAAATQRSRTTVGIGTLDHTVPDRANSDGSTLPDVDGPTTMDEAQRPRVRALVVDDSLPVRIQMKIALGGVADEVDFAETGEEGQALLAEHRYDLVFLDVILPGIDGYEVCKAIKRNPQTSSTPVIMLTSSSSPADRVKGRLAGCDTYLIKPVRKAVFEEVVRDYLSARPAA